MSSTITHPLPGGRLTDRFGPRGVVAGLGDLGTHTGQDWAAQEGTPIRAAHSGRVLRAWWDAFPNGAGAGGHMVSILGDDGTETRYAHMMQPCHLPVGSRVIGNTTTVGYVGSTGAATGAHLHFEVLRAGSYVDPLPLITQASNVPVNPEEEEDDMAKTAGFAYKRAGKQINVLVNPVSGFFHEYEASEGGYNSGVARAFDTGSFEQISESHARKLESDCAAVRAGK